MKLLTFAALFACGSSAASANSTWTFNAQRLELGQHPAVPNGHFEEFELTPTVPCATLDYGANVAGFPVFEVIRLSGPAQIEVKYSEQFSGLLEPLGDGPSLFVSSNANSFRVETFNVTQPRKLRSYLIQGGQRWQSIRLLSNSTVKFGKAAFESTVGDVDIPSLPGSFRSSNPAYDDIWSLGARAVSLSCYDAGTQTSTWQVSHEGALVSSSTPSYTALAHDFSEYDLEFDAKIVRGGFIWGAGYNFGIRSRGGILLSLAGNYPPETTFSNTNQSLFPPSTVSLGYGVSFVNQTTLSSYRLDTFPVPFEVQEGAWYRVLTIVRPGYLSVSLNQSLVFNVSLDSYSSITGSTIPTVGSFGFGAWQDQSAYVRNVSARDTTGSVIYQNTMTDAAVVLPEYGTHDNYFPTCVDGAKRDRLVWLGDFVHTSRIVGVSTGRADHVSGTFKQLLTYQLPSGQLPMAPSLGYAPETDPATFAVGGLAHLLPDYHILGLISFVSYMQWSDDLAFARDSWNSWVSAVDWLASYSNNSTGLIDLSRFQTAFLGPPSGSAVNTAAVSAFRGMASVAAAINDVKSYEQWTRRANALAKAINVALWNEESGVYSIQASDPGNFSTAAIGFAITAGIANDTQAQRSLSHLPSLQLGPGYRDSTASNSSDPSINLSPNVNGFLLPALMQKRQVGPVRFLLDNLWGAMIANETTNSGASWEYVGQDFQPGYGQYTSLSHPWGGGATYALTEYVAGIRPVDFGYKTWVVEPAYAGLGLSWVTATVPTPHGSLGVKWSLQDSILSVEVDSPAGTKGTLKLSKDWACAGEVSGSDKYAHVKDYVRSVKGGTNIQFKVNIGTLRDAWLD